MKKGKLEKSGPERHGPVLDKFGEENERRSHWTSTRSKMAKREAFRGRGAPFGLEECAQKQEIHKKKVSEKIAGQELFHW